MDRFLVGLSQFSKPGETKRRSGVSNNAETVSRNGIAAEYGIATLLLEMRAMSDHYLDGYALGLRSNGYLIGQTVTTLTAAASCTMFFDACRGLRRSSEWTKSVIG